MSVLISFFFLIIQVMFFFFFFSSRRRHTRCSRDWSPDVCSSDLALSEARRATFDPTYGRYTWGKLEILKLRERARKDWGAGFSLQRFHKAMLDLGSPPIGLLPTVLQGGSGQGGLGGSSPRPAEE